MKRILNNIFLRRIADLVLSPVTLFSAIWYKYIRTGNIRQMPISELIFMKVGILPISDHYYQPLINPSKHLRRPLDEIRLLPGIEWNRQGQLALLKKFNFADELLLIPWGQKEIAELQFYYDNPSLCPADAEFLYNMIRLFKPKKVVEIGCGYSTLMALQAEIKNKVENGTFTCDHVCIEPYEMPWLERLPVEVIRSKVEEVPLTLFTELEANDILFIDSTHMIRPQGDVLFEFLEVLPLLRPGVLIHVHDVFSPRDYPKEWIFDLHSQWNEQYLLEAFLSNNNQFQIIGAVNFLKHSYSKELEEKCPNTGKIPEDQPGSFWITRI
jgi:Methyltransferase domain